MHKHGKQLLAIVNNKCYWKLAYLTQFTSIAQQKNFLKEIENKSQKFKWDEAQLKVRPKSKS